AARAIDVEPRREDREIRRQGPAEAGVLSAERDAPKIEHLGGGRVDVQTVEVAEREIQPGDVDHALEGRGEDARAADARDGRRRYGIPQAREEDAVRLHPEVESRSDPKRDVADE